MSILPTFNPWGPIYQAPPWWWLVVRGSCRVVENPLPLLMLMYGADITARELLARWRCKRCGKRPKAATWMDDPARAAPSHPGRPPLRVKMRITGDDRDG